MTYSIINRRDIPPMPPATNERYGEWLALARTIRLMPADRAVCIELGGMSPATAASSIHGAARRVGIKLSTMRISGKLYAVRVGTQEPLADRRIKFTCKHCRLEMESTTPNQEYCNALVCQGARKRKNNRALRDRRQGTN